MKKVFLMIVISIVTLASCSSDTETAVEQPSIIGEWKVVSATQNGKQIILSSCDLNTYIEFLQNKDCNIDSGYLDTNGKCISDSSKGTYTFIENTITYKEGNLTESRARISELTTSSLKYTSYYEGDFWNGRWYVEEIPANEQVTLTLQKIK